MSRTRTTGVLAALGGLGAALLVVVASPTAVSALPGGCTSTWNGSVSTNWSTAGNWSPAGVPNGPAAIACIPAFETVDLSSVVNVAAVHIDDFSDLNIGPGEALFASGPTVSSWSAQSQVFVDGGTLGGTGRVEVHGELHFTGGSLLSSVPAAAGASYAGTIGVLDVATDGRVAIDDQGLFLRTLYRIENDGLLSVNNASFIAADYGTSMLNESTATLRFNGDGGYYRGSPVAGRPLSQIVNRGLIDKAGGEPTVVDAWYVQEGAGHIQVNCCTVLALPDDLGITAQVLPDQTLGTGRCAAQATGTCLPSVDPAVDPMSVSLQIPNANPQPAVVALQELTQPPDTTDSRAIGSDVFAHADQLAVNPASPAVITLRFSQADVMSTPLSEVQVGHISDTGVMTKTPDCISGTIPPGAPYCVVRPVTRTAQNTFVTVLTTQTSRWRLRRTGPTENFDQTAPSAPQAPSVTKPSPGDGSVLRLAWSAPAGDGGAAVSSYRVFLDGQQVATTTGLSADVQNPGLGAHTLEVSAVNIVGASARVGATTTVKKLSKPRGVKALQGAKGGKLTAGVKWKAPASAGGLQIKTYQVVVLNKAGKVVLKKKVSASKHKLLLKLPRGKYRFKVRAKNLDKYGPFSKPTDLISPR